MNKLGYTLLEVTLFMAISAFLAVVAFVGLGPRLRNIRFTDSMRSLESNVVKNFAQSTSGVNKRSGTAGCELNASGVLIVNTEPNQPGESGLCINNGVVAIFGLSGGNSVIYRNILSLREPRVGCTDPGNALQMILQCHNSTIVTTGSAPDTVYPYANGLNQTSGHTAFAYLIDPNSSATYRMQLTASTATSYDGLISNTTNFTRQEANDHTFSICYAMGSRRASLDFSNQSLTPKTTFNQECT